MTTILHKRGTGIPPADQLRVGEIAIDTYSGATYTKLSNGAVVEIGGGSGTGAGMVISPTEPVDKVDGLQWLESTTAKVWVWDEDKWLEFPAAGGSVEGSGLIEVSENPPDPPYEIGQQWFSSTDGYLYIWYGAEWVAIGGAGGGGGGGSGGDGGGDSGGGDPYWSDVALLINADGQPDGSQLIFDEAQNYQVTVVNNAKVSTGDYKYGTGSVSFDKASSSMLTMNTFSFPDGAFTFECWFKFRNGTANASGIFAGWGGDASKRTIEADIQSGNTLRTQICVRTGPGAHNQVTLSSGDAVAPDTWHHVAITNDESMVYCHLNGNLVGTHSLAGNSVNTNFDQFSIGQLWNSGQYLDGFVDDFRVTDGVARYDGGDFTPPEKHPTSQARKMPKIITVEPIETQEGSNDVELS